MTLELGSIETYTIRSTAPLCDPEGGARNGATLSIHGNYDVADDKRFCYVIKADEIFGTHIGRKLS